MQAPVAPSEAVEQYLNSLHDVKPKTQDEHKYRLRHFIRWVDTVELNHIGELEPFDLERYKNHRITETECNLVTVKNHLHTFRQFLRWCENTGIIEDELADKVWCRR